MTFKPPEDETKLLNEKAADLMQAIWDVARKNSHGQPLTTLLNAFSILSQLQGSMNQSMNAQMVDVVEKMKAHWLSERPAS